MRDGPAHFHDQPASREEEGGPAGIGGGSDQDFTGGQMRTRWIEDNARLRCHCSWRCRRPPQHALRLASCIRGNSAGFGAVGDQHARNVAAAHFEVVGCAVIAHRVMHIFSCQCSVDIWQREEEDISGSFQPASLFQFFTNCPPQVTHARHQHDDDELWHLTQPNKIARSSQEEVNEPTPQPALAPCPLDQFCEHAFGLPCSPLELHRRS